MSERLRNLFQRIRLYIQVTHMGAIARRYFFKNGFDGSMTMLGIVVGAWIAGVSSPLIIVAAGLGACLAMGVSGLFGAYMTEKAERERSLKELEESMLASLKESILNDASNFVSVYAALVDGLSPALTAIVSLIPFLLSMRGLLAIKDAYPLSLTLTLVMLFSLGLYLGRIAKANLRRRLLYAGGMVAAGLIVAAVVLILGGG